MDKATGQDETVVVLVCGCTLMLSRGEMRWCTLHNAAPDLLAALEEFLDLREWVIESGGTKGPLAQDVIRKFAEMQSGVVERARAAIAKAKP